MCRNACSSTHIIWPHLSGIGIRVILCDVLLFIQSSGVDDCRHIPGPTNSSVEVVEHSKHTFDFTIKGTKDIPLQWCYHGTDNYSACCVCNDPQSNDPQSKCQVKDWTTDLYSNKCNHYSCVLTIHNISMNYSNGMLVSTAVVSDNDTKNINYTRIFVTQDSSTHKSQPVTLYYIVVVMGIIAATIVTVTCGIFVIKRTYRWSRSYYLHHDYEAIKSPTAGKSCAHYIHSLRYHLKTCPRNLYT